MHAQQSLYAKCLQDINRYKGTLGETHDPESMQECILDLEQELLQIESKVCPFCSNSMRDITPIYKNLIDLAWIGDYSNLALNADFYPKQWECQDCYAFDVRANPQRSERWLPNSLLDKTILPNKLFENFPFLNEVAFTQTMPKQTWFVRIQEQWYVLPGTEEEIIKRLSM